MQSKQAFTTNIHYDMAMISLDFLHRGDSATILELPDIRLLSSLGLRVGKQVKMLTKSLAKGPYILSVNNRSIAIDSSVAKQIIVRR